MAIVRPGVLMNPMPTRSVFSSRLCWNLLLNSLSQRNGVRQCAKSM
jgi:hypothetical protein